MNCASKFEERVLELERKLFPNQTENGREYGVSPGLGIWTDHGLD